MVKRFRLRSFPVVTASESQPRIAFRPPTPGESTWDKFRSDSESCRDSNSLISGRMQPNCPVGGVDRLPRWLSPSCEQHSAHTATAGQSSVDATSCGLGQQISRISRAQYCSFDRRRIPAAKISLQLRNAFLATTYMLDGAAHRAHLAPALRVQPCHHPHCAVRGGTRSVRAVHRYSLTTLIYMR